jgi:ribonuclease HII
MLIVGTDEVGRGCIAGPIVAASFALSPQALLSIKYSIENSLKDETRSLHVNRLNRAIKLLEHDLKICSENHTDSHCGLDSKSHSLDDWNTDVLQFVFDSKKVSEKNRQKICNIFAPLKNFAIGQVEAEEIDKKG